MILPNETDLQQARMLSINPLSCIGLCEIVDHVQPQNVLISAAASQLGRMLVRTLRNKHPTLQIYGLTRNLRNAPALLK
jgi:NADPH:quinone reductase-like Zn-dependent oxidoreductase